MIPSLEETARSYMNQRNVKLNYDFLATNHELVKAIERWKELLQIEGINSKKVVSDEMNDLLDNKIFFIKKGTTK
jgi:hypothetical protein